MLANEEVPPTEDPETSPEELIPAIVELPVPQLKP